MTMTAATPIPTTINEATRALAPEDALDRKHRHGGDLSNEERRELLDRRISVVKAGLAVAGQYAGAREEVLEQAMTWIEKPSGKSAGVVKNYLDASDLVEMARTKLSPARQAGIQAKIAAGKEVRPEEFEGELVARAVLGSKDRQAEYHLLRACFTPYSSDAAGGLRVIAYAGASMHERAQNPSKPGGWGHPFVVGLINAARR